MSVSERLAALEVPGIKLGLSNIERISAALGHPQRAYTTVHVAGTNGKGSVVAMVHGALRAGAVPAARYTSPHLSTIRERFVIGDLPVDPVTYEDAATRVLDTIDGLVASGALTGPPTFFEATTAIAFVLFREAGIRVAVIEVGLGGRFDSTNVVAPAVTAITSIAMDHERFLGRTRAAIAFEKAGIVKPGVPVVIGALPPDADAVVRAVAADVDAPVIAVVTADDRVLAAEGGRAGIVPATGVLAGTPVRVGLPGDHQAGNALVAYHVLGALTGRTRIALGADAVRAGLERTAWPGRLDVLTAAGGRRILFDAAHNPHGAEALATYLRQWYAPRPPVVFGVMHDKDIPGMLRHLLPVTGPIVLAPMTGARPAPPGEVAQVIRSIDPARACTVAESVPAALERAWQYGSDIVAAGSIQLLGEVRDALNPRAILP